MMDLKNLNRLLALGLPHAVAIEVMQGKIVEAEALRTWRERREAKKWGESKENRRLKLIPLWDRDPGKFYLALDGEDADVFAIDEIKLIEADTADVHQHLGKGSSRDVDPWHHRYRDKTSLIAYRWHCRLLNTPPLLVPQQSGQLEIGGGMHRFHLAHHYEHVRMPFLVHNRDEGDALAILTSGRRSEAE